MDKKKTDMLLDDLSTVAEKNNLINPGTYSRYHIKRGLRNSNGTGVLVGMTKVGYVHGYDLQDGIKSPDHGKLYYRGINLEQIVNGFQKDKRRGFEETVYLLLLGKLPSQEELKEFNGLLDSLRKLPSGYTENMILKIPSKNIMNKLQRSILVLYSHDENPDDTRVRNLLRQSIELTARIPTIISYGYQAKAHYFDKKSLFIHAPKEGAGTAENILHMIRPDNKYTEIEAETLDLCLVIHAEHGGGNNSAFTTHVVSSAGTDTYSAMAASVGALKGSKHGGANRKVKEMIQDIKQNVSNLSDKGQLKEYLLRILHREAFNRKGLIYGMGHAVYTRSDPRAVLLKKKALELAQEKGAEHEFNLYQNIEDLTIEIFRETKGPDFIIAANVDLYSGFVYEMLNIPVDLYTPIFAAARIAGWSAHRIEQIVSDSKIMRPAYVTVNLDNRYMSMDERQKGSRQKKIRGISAEKGGKINNGQGSHNSFELPQTR